MLPIRRSQIDSKLYFRLRRSLSYCYSSTVITSQPNRNANTGTYLDSCACTDPDTRACANADPSADFHSYIIPTSTPVPTPYACSTSHHNTLPHHDTYTCSTR